jgi:hypothetical protein
VRIISPFPTGFTAIIINAKGASTYVSSGELFQQVPFEDPWAQGIDAGYVQVPQGELEEGCFQLVPNSSETTVGGNTLVNLSKVADFPNNKFAGQTYQP